MPDFSFLHNKISQEEIENHQNEILEDMKNSSTAINLYGIAYEDEKILAYIEKYSQEIKDIDKAKDSKEKLDFHAQIKIDKKRMIVDFYEKYEKEYGQGQGLEAIKILFDGKLPDS